MTFTNLNTTEDRFNPPLKAGLPYCRIDINGKTKQLRPIAILLLVLYSCSGKEQNQVKTKTPEVEIVSDSTNSAPVEQYRPIELPEPFDVSKIETIVGLDFTSGILPENDYGAYCDNSESGIYGFYNLIDIRSKSRPQLVGGIDIYKPDKTSAWRASDTNQKVWRIHLRSEVISVWDSIQVGLTRDDIVEFGQANKGVCHEKGDHHYSCHFNNFSVVCIFENDTIQELTITRNCERVNNGN